MLVCISFLFVHILCQDVRWDLLFSPCRYDEISAKDKVSILTYLIRVCPIAFCIPPNIHNSLSPIYPPQYRIARTQILFINQKIPFHIINKKKTYQISSFASFNKRKTHQMKSFVSFNKKKTYQISPFASFNKRKTYQITSFASFNKKKTY